MISVLTIFSIWSPARAETNCAKDIQRMKTIEAKLVALDPSDKSQLTRGGDFSEEIYNIHERYTALPEMDECQRPMWKAYVSLEISFYVFQNDSDSGMFAMIADVAKIPPGADTMVAAAAEFTQHHQNSPRATCMLQGYRSALHGPFCYFETAKQKCFEEQTDYYDCMK